MLNEKLSSLKINISHSNSTQGSFCIWFAQGKASGLRWAGYWGAEISPVSFSLLEISNSQEILGPCLHLNAILIPTVSELPYIIYVCHHLRTQIAETSFHIGVRT
jgi:hypothetical protein